MGRWGSSRWRAVCRSPAICLSSDGQGAMNKTQKVRRACPWNVAQNLTHCQKADDNFIVGPARFSLQFERSATAPFPAPARAFPLRVGISALMHGGASLGPRQQG
jgi:hypothetical protein